MAGEGTVGTGLNRAVYWIGRHWLLLFLVVWGAVNLLPWLAPVFMKLGWEGAGRAIYLLYRALCHQLPQRSFFLFGSSPTYELGEIQLAWQNTDNPMILRQFNGDTTMGWKVAWSDRMVYLYTGLLLWTAAQAPWRRRLPRLPLRGLILLALPLVLDGGSHAVSDLVGGIGGGFRFDNGWLAAVTTNAFPASFYSGDGFGSFNSWMRLASGLLFALGGVWFALPALESSFGATARRIGENLEQAGLPL